MAISKSKSESEIADWIECVDILLATIKLVQQKKKTYPIDLPEGSVLINIGSDLHRMFNNWKEPFLFEIGFCIIDNSGLKHYFTGKINPMKGDVRICGFTKRYEREYLGDEVYRYPIAVPIQHMQRFRDYMEHEGRAGEQYMEQR